MDFGMPTLLETKSLEVCAALCHELGLAFIELNMDLPEYQADMLDPSQLSDIAGRFGIYYTIHLEDTASPWDFNNHIAAAYIETVLQTIRIAKRISIPVLNMHFHQGEYFTLPERKVYLFKEYPYEYRQKLIAFRDTCKAAIGNADIKICIENTRSFQLDYVEEGISLLLESPVFGLTFDIGHNAGNNFQQQPVIEHNINRLHHMHLHDYERTHGDHLPLGEGELDLLKYLHIAKTHNCRVVLETKTIAGLKESIEWIKSKGR
ncbi:MAG: TIM barrel protein [Eubacteriales bacterium]|nr:TIM barrel protein [Eubacteriales bacterium]